VSRFNLYKNVVSNTTNPVKQYNVYLLIME